MVTQDRDEELALFLEVRRREKGQGASLLTGSDNSSYNGGTPETLSSLRYPLRRTAAENFLYSENEKSDYEWLLTPPGTPQFEKESQRSAMRQVDVPSARPTALKSRLGNCREELVSRTDVSSKLSVSTGLSSSDVTGIRRPSSSGGLTSTTRPSPSSSRGLTSTTRPSSSGGLKSASRPSTPTSRSTTPAAATSTTTKASSSRSSTPTTRTKASSSRSSTPTSRAALTAARSAPPARSATPTRPIARPSSTQSLPATKSRSATPTRQPSTLTGPSTVSTKATASVNKPAPSRGTSPTVRSRPWKPSEMPGFSLDAPPNLRTTLPDRPPSASRGRPGASAPSSRSNSIERSGGGRSDGRVRRQSCSPSRGRAPIGNANGSLTAVPSVRGRAKVNSSGDNVSPVAVGTRMVERVVNMRKLAPPRQTESSGKGLAGKPNSSLDSLGYGRSLSKSSLDMALRHMDIRRSITGNLRPLVTKVPASSMYSVRSSMSGRSRPASVSDSPLATSSTTSSEPSVSNININVLCLDGSEAEDSDLLSEKGNFSPRSQPEKLTF